MKNIKYFYLGSDLHGDATSVKNWVKNYLPTPIEESALILLGDIGANYYGDYRDRNFKKELNKLGIVIYCLRGNHEMRVSDAATYSNYSFSFDENCGGKIWWESGFPNIRYFKDEGGFYCFNGHLTLVIPGAYSVDKFYRLEMGWNWFFNEQLTPEEMNNLFIIAHNQSFDYVLAHTCPFSWEPYIDDLFMGGIDQSKINKRTEIFLDKIIENINFKHFYFGHFHDDRDLAGPPATMLFKQFIPLGEYLTKQVDK